MKFSIFIITLLFTFKLHAQYYTFEVDNGTYENLVGSTSLNNEMTWGEEREDIFTIPIGFDFEYFGITTAQFELYSGRALLINPPSDIIVSFIVPYEANIVDRGWDTALNEPTPSSLSNLSYLLEGTVGSRILKIEWNNIGYREDLFDDGVSTDFTNFQVWIYEGTNTLEVHFGTNSITQPNLIFYGDEGSNGVVLGHNYNIDTEDFQEIMTLEGDPTNPSVNLGSIEGSLDGVIPNGTIYRYTENTAAISEQVLNSDRITIFPNPSNNYFQIFNKENDLTINSISIFNIMGQEVKTVIYKNEGAINISNLDVGVYFVKVNTDSGTLTKRIIKN